MTSTPGIFLEGILGLGWAGVDLFFVLSGFLIGSILLRNHGAQNYYVTFYTRRAYRILPLYVLVLAVFTIIRLLVPVAIANAEIFRLVDHPLPVLTYLTFTQNVAMALRGDFGAQWLGPTWSLAIEEQFYLLLPFTIAMISAPLLSKLLFAYVLLAPMLRALVAYLHGGFACLVLLPTRADELFLGVLVALAMRSDWWRSTLWIHRGKLLVLAFGGLLCAWAFNIANHLGFRGLVTTVGYSSLGVSGASLLAYLLLARDSNVYKFFCARVLRWLGVRCYGLYLLHEVVGGLVASILRPEGLQIRSPADFLPIAGCLVVTLVLADVSWRYLETPFIAMGHRHRYNVPVSSVERG